MKKNLFLLICSLTLLPLAGCARQNSGKGNRIRVISYNVRMSGQPKVDLDNFWDNRKQASVDMVEKEQPTVMGIQEGCPDQIAFLDANLPHYKRIGVGRDDGKAGGEMMAIYYDTNKVEVGENSTFWLSETPGEVSRGWDGACRRTCTWGIFTVKATGKKFCFFNTHLDHKGKQARAEGLKLIVAKMAELVPAGMPVFLSADFNSETGNPIFDPLKAVMKDARETARKTDRGTTFNGFGKREGRVVVIDHIFYDNARADRFAVLRGDYGAPYISDHYPIVLDARLE